MIDLPSSISQITPAWLSEVFGGEIDSLRVEHLGGGRGFMSEVARLHLESRDEDIPNSVVIKMPATNSQKLDIAKSFDSYKREAYFYQHIAPSAPIRSPGVFFNEGTSGKFVLILEDLRELRTVDQIKGARNPDTLTAIQTLGRLHRGFWGQSLDTMHSYQDDIAFVSCDYSKVLPGALEIVELRTETREWLERLVCNYESVMRAHLEKPCSLIHCDYKLDNLAFSDDGLVVYDWGDVSVGPIGYDVAHFLVGSLTTSERRSNERVLVREYQKTLGVPGYTQKKAWNDYLCFIPAAFYVAALLVSFKEKNIRASQFSSINILRGAHAIEDHFQSIRELYSDSML